MRCAARSTSYRNIPSRTHFMTHKIQRMNLTGMPSKHLYLHIIAKYPSKYFESNRAANCYIFIATHVLFKIWAIMKDLIVTDSIV